MTSKPLFGDIDQEEFFRSFWRRSPLFVKGGARALLESGTTEPEFIGLADKLARIAPADVSRDSADVIFAQNLDRVSPRLARLSRRLSRQMGCPSIWFDGVLARDGRSIRCHYDHSDNFVLQQQGTKAWRLHSPEIIPRDEIRRRMLNEPGGGAMYMPDEHLEFRLEEGDLLYIPLFWVHHGVSEGPSLSLSLVLNATTFLDEMLPLLRRLLADREAWWKAAPVCPPGMRQDRRGLEREVEDLLSELGSSWLRDDLLRLWRESRVPRQGVRRQRAHLARPREIAIDTQKIELLYGDDLGPIDLARLVTPEGWRGQNGTLARMVGRIYLRRFLRVAIQGWETGSEEVRTSLCNAVHLFQLLPATTMLQAMVRPELTSWVLRAVEACSYNYPPRFETVARHLGSFLLPFLISSRIAFEDEPLTIAPSTPSSVQLFSLCREVAFPRVLDDSLRARCTGDDLLFELGRDRWRLPLECLEEELPEPGRVGELELRPLQATPGNEAFFCRRNTWYEAFLPRGKRSRVSDVYPEIEDGEFRYLGECMGQGYDLVHRFWPEAWEELVENVVTIMPLRSHGLRPHNETIPAFRGLIRSSARPSYLAAQALVHEGAHNKFNSILDVFEMQREGAEELFHSPFVDQPRPLVALLHGIFAFLNDAAISVRLAGQVEEVEGLSIERYIHDLTDKLDRALETVGQKARLTPEGEQVGNGLARGVCELKTCLG